MQDDPLAIVLIVLAASVLVVALARRVGLPTIQIDRWPVSFFRQAQRWRVRLRVVFRSYL